MYRQNESGSHVLGLLLAFVAIGVIGFAGYRVVMMQPSAIVPPKAVTKSVTAPAKITNTANLNQAANALDSASAQVNSGLDDSGLNSDLSNLL